MLTDDDLAKIRSIVREELRPSTPITAPAPRASAHPLEAAVTAFLTALPAGRAFTSRELHAAFLGSPHAVGICAHASVVTVGIMASRARGRLVTTSRTSAGTVYRRAFTPRHL